MKNTIILLIITFVALSFRLLYGSFTIDKNVYLSNSVLDMTTPENVNIDQEILKISLPAYEQ